MLHFAICDDDHGQLALLGAYTEQFCQTHQIEAKLHLFNHPDELLTSSETHHYHLYILDIVMPMINGVEVGKAIRKRDEAAIIIFATHEPSFALESFAATPINYLLKPIDMNQLSSTLLQALPKMEPQKEKTCIIKTREGIRVLRFSEILYCECKNHSAIYTLTGERTVTTKILKGTFSHHIEPLLKDARFLRPHISYLVNMDYIEGFSQTRFTLRSGGSVPIVARHYRKVRDSYLTYLTSGENAQCRN